MKIEYDVFISSKSADYEYARDVYKFLTSKGFRVFFADEKIREIGKSDFTLVINEALTQSKHFVLVISSMEYLHSHWVWREWSGFFNMTALKEKEERGQMLNILCGNMTQKDLEALLISSQSYFFTDYKNHVISFFSDPPKDNPLPEIYYNIASQESEPDIPEKSKPIVPDNYLSDLFGKLRCKAATISPYDLLDKLGLDKSQLKRLLKENYGISLDNKDLMKSKTVEALETLIKIAKQRNKKRNEQQNQH